MSTNSIVPHTSYPSSNKNTSYLVPPLWRKPGPIKHYRRQLQPAIYSHSSRRTSIYLLNTPGGSSYKGAYTCTDDSSIKIIKNEIIQSTPCLGTVNLLKYNTCIGGTMSITRSGSAGMSQTQYNSTAEYLQSRCKTANQSEGVYRGMFKTFTSELFESPHCALTNKYMVYKPNNRIHAQQGGVSSSSRMARLKYTVQTRNGAYFMNARGARQMNKGRYASSGVNTNIREKETNCKTYANKEKKLAHENCVVVENTETNIPETTTLTITTPILFETILEQSYTPTLSAMSSISALAKILLYCDDTTYLSIDSNYDITFTLSNSITTYEPLLLSTFHLIEDTIYPGYYRIDSEMHSMYSLDYDSTYTLIFRNAWGYDRDTNSGYLIFEIDITNNYLIAYKRFVYDGTPYIEDTSFIQNSYVVYSSGIFSFTTTPTNSNIVFYEDTLYPLMMPTVFNPAATPYVTNERVSWSAIDSYENNNIYDNGSASLIYINMESAYQPQVLTSGNDTDTSLEASTMLSAIQEAVEGEGNSLQYDPAVYIAFRNGLLNTTLQSNTIVNGEIGQTTAPYVYFTNETDDNGIYHPFMVIASHSIADKPNRLLDVASPPGDGSGNYETASVTRDATLGTFLFKIPMKNYGYVTSVTDNTMSNSLYADANATTTESVYNRVSISSIGVAIDGVSIYPVLNNTLTPAAEKSEITNTGIHVGQGMQLHYHADGHSATGNGLNLYNITDYVGSSHPPLIGFGLDGIALYGKYEASYDSMDGYDEALDDYGGHTHGDYGYHYHAHEILNAVSTIGDNAGSITGAEYTYHALMKGAWYGLINDIPEFWNENTGAPAISFAQVNRYVGNESSSFGIDVTPPVLEEETVVSTPSNDNTPSYTFSSDEVGTIACSVLFTSTTSAVAGYNTITFDTLGDGTYSNITITVTDATGNVSDPLTVSSFTIDTISPILVEVTVVSTPSSDTTPSYTFSSDEAGTITCSVSFTSTTSAVVGDNTITFDTLGAGTYSNITITVTDTAGNASNSLTVSSFTITEPSWSLIEQMTGATGDKAGYSVAMNGDGDRMIVASYGITSSNDTTQIYELSGGSWSSMTMESPNGGYTLSNCGCVAMSANGLIAASWDDGNNEVFIYEYQDPKWWNIEYITVGLGSVSISDDGTRLAIGNANNKKVTLIEGTGNMGVSNMTWTEVGYLEHTSSPTSFGTSVSLSGDGNYIAVGAPLRDTSTFGTGGAVYAYEWAVGTEDEPDWGGESSVAGTWEYQGGDPMIALFGQSVALNYDGTTLVIGSPVDHNCWVNSSNDSGGGPTGVVQLGASHFGCAWSICLNSAGDKIVIGSNLTIHGEMVPSAEIAVYDKDGSSWPTALSAASFYVVTGTTDAMGASVTMNSSGDRIAYGAPLANSDAGYVSTYEYS